MICVLWKKKFRAWLKKKKSSVPKIIQTILRIHCGWNEHYIDLIYFTLFYFVYNDYYINFYELFIIYTQKASFDKKLCQHLNCKRVHWNHEGNVFLIKYIQFKKQFNKSFVSPKITHNLPKYWLFNVFVV